MTNAKKIIGVLSAAFLINIPARATDYYAPANIDGINQTMIDILRQMKILQQEVKQLRGEVELHSHLLEKIKRGQDDNYPQSSVVTTAPKAAPPIVTAPSEPIIQPVLPPPVVISNGIHPAEQAAYDNAFSQLRSGGYEDAIKGFRDFLGLYPNSALAPNCQYWIGEAYYVTRRFREAQAEFQRLMENYPNAAKAPDALLKIGYIQYELNQAADARTSLEDVIARFPQSTAAKLAANRLEKIRR